MILPQILELHTPDDPLPLIFDSPHSGTHYPQDFAYDCPLPLLRRSEDMFVDDLFADAPHQQACLLKALFPRTYIDVNRAETDIDPALMAPDTHWPYEDIPMQPTNRSDAGIGLIRRLVKPGQAVCKTPLTPAAIRHRIDRYYRPYHDCLENLLDSAHTRYGEVWHINCHSMPYAKANKAFRRANPFTAPDFVLGDRDGTVCDPALTKMVKAFLEDKGYKVAINNPYKGVELVRRYSAPAEGRHSLQIEICKSLYMNEETFEKTKNFERLQQEMAALTAFLADQLQSTLLPIAAD